MSRALTVSVVLLPFLVACGDEPGGEVRGESPAPAVTTDPSVRIRERTAATFGRCAQLMPSLVSEGHLPSALAPLILVEGEETGQWGAVTDEGDVAPSAAPVVYYGEGQALAGGQPRRQFDYHWWHRASADAPWAAQGVRITVDDDGLPLTWEVLRDDSGLRVLYVSEKLERRARRHHGEPLDGRAFTLERSTGDTPRVVVARALADGPVPMGPWAYLRSGAGEVTSLICRCMPSQTTGPLERTDYQLRVWNDLSGRRSPWTQERPDAAPGERLDGWLRWP